DLGIYCVNAARHVFQTEPLAVRAVQTRGDDRRFTEIEEMDQAILEFPGGGLAVLTCSFGAADASELAVWGTKGCLKLKQAFEMAGSRSLVSDCGSGDRGSQLFPRVDQSAPLYRHFSDCILGDRDPLP